MPSILFLCTGNIYRSPLLAALFYRKLQAMGQSEGWVVNSAGTWTIPGRTAPLDAQRAAKSLGVALEGHVTRLVDQDLLTRHNLILVVERGQREALNIEFPFVRDKLYLISEVVDQRTYDIPDPLSSGQPSDELASDLSALIERGYQKIHQLAQSMQSSTS
jgi:protein-tyrosine phosphatase